MLPRQRVGVISSLGASESSCPATLWFEVVALDELVLSMVFSVVSLLH
jgi:hypothetical protein